MTKPKDDARPAFPQGKAVGAMAIVEGGMTIREYAAIQMAAALASGEGYANMQWPGNISEDAVKLADAVLAALDHDERSDDDHGADESLDRPADL